MNVLQLQETISYNHNGVIFYIELDYEKGVASFVEKDGTPKRWLFTERGRDYLGGWLRIYEAMRAATIYADTRLKEQQEARDNAKEEQLIDLAIAISDNNVAK